MTIEAIGDAALYFGKKRFTTECIAITADFLLKHEHRTRSIQKFFSQEHTFFILQKQIMTDVFLLE